MTNQVLVNHSYCQRISALPVSEDGAPLLLALCEHCGQGWEHGYSVLGPVTDDYLRERAPVSVTPAAVEAARSLGVDLREVPPTGAHGEITRGDVRDTFLSKQDALTPPGAPIELSEATKEVIQAIVFEAIASHEQRWHLGRGAEDWRELIEPPTLQGDE